jgi:hypothetical protein
MNKFLSFSASFSTRVTQILTFALLTVLMGVGTSRADARALGLQERFLATVNTMVRSVKATPEPAAKREIIANFLNRVDRGMGMAKVALSGNDRQALALAQAKVEAQYAELEGLKGYSKVADAELNHYAAYLQQNTEQAQAYFGGGGIYLSVGALIIILIILLILL